MNKTVTPVSARKYIEDKFPGADASFLSDDQGIVEAARVTGVLVSTGHLSKVDFALVASYALAFERWVKYAKDASELKTPYLYLANGSVQTHPAVQNEQKYFSIMRASIRHLLAEMRDRGASESSEEDDPLSSYFDDRVGRGDG